MSSSPPPFGLFFKKECSLIRRRERDQSIFHPCTTAPSTRYSRGSASTVAYTGEVLLHLPHGPPILVERCYEPLERFIDIMERRQSNGGQQRHYPFRHPKWRYPYLEGPSTRPYIPTRSLREDAPERPGQLIPKKAQKLRASRTPRASSRDWREHKHTLNIKN